jgi:hypothetical protein
VLFALSRKALPPKSRTSRVEIVRELNYGYLLSKPSQSFYRHIAQLFRYNLHVADLCLAKVLYVILQFFSLWEKFVGKTGKSLHILQIVYHLRNKRDDQTTYRLMQRTPRHACFMKRTKELCCSVVTKRCAVRVIFTVERHLVSVII